MSILAVVPQAATVTLAFGSQRAFQSSELPPSSTPLRVLEHASKHRPHAVALGSDLPTFTGFLSELAQLLQARLGLPTAVISEEHVASIPAEARLTGTALFQRTAAGPKLAVWYAARLAGAELGLSESESHFVVAYVGETVVAAAVQNGMIVDMSCPYDEGPFSASASGGLPFAQLLNRCRELGSREEALLEVTQRGGFKGYLNVQSLADAETLAWARHDADWIYSAFIYQLAKEIGAYAAVLKGRHRAVVLTGPHLPTNGLRGLQSYFGSTVVLNYPGDYSIHAVLALGEQLITSRKGMEEDGIC